MIEIYKCRLGCGQLIHDIDEHVDFAHPEARQDFPKAQLPADDVEDSPEHWDRYYAVADKRTMFIKDNFSMSQLMPVPQHDA